MNKLRAHYMTRKLKNAITAHKNPNFVFKFDGRYYDCDEREITEAEAADRPIINLIDELELRI